MAVSWAGETETGDKCGSVPDGINEALALERERELGEHQLVITLVGVHQLRTVAAIVRIYLLARED